MQRKGRVFKVKADLPEGVDPDEFADYLAEAAHMWKKCFDPVVVDGVVVADPLVDADLSIEVSYRDNNLRNSVKE